MPLLKGITALFAFPVFLPVPLLGKVFLRHMWVADMDFTIMGLYEIGHELKHVKQNIQIVVIDSPFGNDLVVGVASQRGEDHGNRFATLGIFIQFTSPLITVTFEYLHDAVKQLFIRMIRQGEQGFGTDPAGGVREERDADRLLASTLIEPLGVAAGIGFFPVGFVINNPQRLALVLAIALIIPAGVISR